jgi:uncharacterized protein involved in exopolysaccharide biosynthesis
MRFPGTVIVLSLFIGAGCKPGESAHLRACQAELVQKDRQISQLRAQLQATVTTAQERGISGDTELFARETRIRDLQRQLESANTQIIRGERQALDVIENQRRSFQERVEGLQERVAELEKKLAQKN